jgi:hypothetical protein
MIFRITDETPDGMFNKSAGAASTAESRSWLQLPVNNARQVSNLAGVRVLGNA